MSTAVTHAKILLLAKSESRSRALMERLGDDVEVAQVATIDAALAKMRDQAFDCIVSDQGDFVALERAVLNQQSAMILENIGQGICIVATDGKLIWANPKMQSYSDEIRAQVCEVCQRTFGGDSTAEASRPGHLRARRVNLTCGKDEYFEVTITPICSSQGTVVQIAAVLWDVTQNRRLQKRIDAIDMAGRELVRLDGELLANMNVEERFALLEDKIFRFLHEMMHFDDFAVLLLDKKTVRLKMVLQHGMSQKSRDIDLMASPEQNGISGYVAATGRSYICHDTSQDPRYIRGLESAKSSLTVPLRLHDKIIGVLDIESDRIAAFNEEDRQYAEILARNVAMALHMLDLLIIERNESTERLADDVIDEIAGPLNDIITDASTLMEEYIGHDDLRNRLGAICDHVTNIKTKVKEVATPKKGILTRGGDKVTSDPLLAGKHVLVADDEEIIRDTIGGVLRKCGCDVDIVADGGAAIERLKSKAYDMIVADIRMPFRNGYEVFAAAKDLHPKIAVILMTGFGYDPNHSIVRARKEGLSAVLFKPFKVEQLLSEARAAISSGS